MDSSVLNVKSLVGAILYEDGAFALSCLGAADIVN